MKKGFVIMIAVMLVCAFALCGCGVETSAMAHTNDGGGASLDASTLPDGTSAATQAPEASATPTQAEVKETAAPTDVPVSETAVSETAAPDAASPKTAAPDAAILDAAKKAYDDKLYELRYAKLEKIALTPFANIREMMEQYAAFVEMSAELHDMVEEASLAAEKVLSDAGVIAVRGAARDLSDWQETASLMMAFGDEAIDLIMSKLKCDVSYSDGIVRICVDYPASMRELLTHCDADCAFHATFVYAYLRTVYDDSGVEKDFVQYELPKGYIYTLADPLPGKYNIKDGWYAGRQKNTRKHTGTDIRIAGGTDIYSCTTGVVTFVGSNDVAGNYVAVLDPMGFEYHYYHMIELTDFLKAGDKVECGQLIGHVGNTGNSDADHLHLAIVTPEFTYMNPYPVLLEMRNGKVN